MIKSDNMRGAALMVVAMLGFALEDMSLKMAMRVVPVGEALVIFGVLGMFSFIGLAQSRGQRVFHPAVLSKVMALRAVSEVLGRLGYTLGFVMIPLSNASAILQATPLVVVAAAAMIFGEKVGWQRWLAVVIGFIGVLIILRPGVEGFSAGSIFAVVGMLGFAGRDLATRAAPPVLSNFQLGIYGFFMLIPSGLILIALSGDVMIPETYELRWITLAAAVGVLAYWALTSAMRLGEISVVTPFRYTRLPFALIAGAMIFDERPDWPMLLGGVLIVGSGIYTLTHARAAAKRLPGVAPAGVDPRDRRP